MNPQNIITSIENFVQLDMEGICNAHDWYHIDRVRKLAKKIIIHHPEADDVVVECGALLHEYFDEKFFTKEQLISREQTFLNYLTSLGISDKKIEKITFITNNIGFGKSIERDITKILPLEFQIVEDADRLESIGAIAIARTFSYGGKKGRKIYDPSIKTKPITSRDAYRNNEITSSLHHFYEKLLLLKDLLHTQAAKDIAKKRHAFMELYLEEFLGERNCKI